MKTISIFNNKGGVGKTTLGYNVASTLGELGFKVLVIDLDPQCNFTIYSLHEDFIESMWQSEEPYIADFDKQRKLVGEPRFNSFIQQPRSIHFILKPVQDGTAGFESLIPPVNIAENFDLIPGRLSMYSYENTISARWNNVLAQDPLSIRTVSAFRKISEDYSSKYGYDFVFFDTSPNLGAMNKVAISTADGFLIPCLPDLFSLYGVKNIGGAIAEWNKEFQRIDLVLDGAYSEMLPRAQASLIGYLIYNAKKYSAKSKNKDKKDKWDLAIGHLKHAEQIPFAIETSIPKSALTSIDSGLASLPIGNMAIMHTHNTLAGMAQSYKMPMWKIPGYAKLEEEDLRTVNGNREDYIVTNYKYKFFVIDMLARFGDEYRDRIRQLIDGLFEDCYSFIEAAKKSGVQDLDPATWLTDQWLKDLLYSYCEDSGKKFNTL